DREQLAEVLGHERLLHDLDLVEVALQERVEPAVLLAELDVEVRLVDADAGDHAAVLGGDGDRLVLRRDILRRLEDRLHDERGRAPGAEATEGGADPAPFAAYGVAAGALDLPLEVDEELAAGLGIAADVRLPGALRR